MEFLYGLPLLLKAFILGIVEGLTEFLPISSTGHLILAGALLGWTDQKAKLFDVAIQTGAMFAIIWYYRRRIGATVAGIGRDPVARRFACNVAVAFLPAAILGMLFAGSIKAHLFRPVPVAVFRPVIWWPVASQRSPRPSLSRALPMSGMPSGVQGRRPRQTSRTSGLSPSGSIPCAPRRITLRRRWLIEKSSRTSSRVPAMRSASACGLTAILRSIR